MSKQSSSWNHSGKRLRPGQCLQVFLLVAVGIWLMYQLGHCYKRRAVAVEIGGSRGVDGELIRRRWLDRKSLIKFTGVVSEEVDSGIIAGNDDAAERKPRTSKGREDEGDEDDDGLFCYDDGDETILRMVKVNKSMNWIEPLFVGSTLPAAARKMMVLISC